MSDLEQRKIVGMVVIGLVSAIAIPCIYYVTLNGMEAGWLWGTFVVSVAATTIVSCLE